MLTTRFHFKNKQNLILAHLRYAKKVASLEIRNFFCFSGKCFKSDPIRCLAIPQREGTSFIKIWEICMYCRTKYIKEIHAAEVYSQSKVRI